MSKFPEFTLGLVLGVCLTCCFCFPRVGRAIGKLIATVAIAVGAGLLAWGIYSALTEDFKPMQAGPLVVHSLSQVFGWSSGCLAGGILALMLSLYGRQTGG
jgi:hypothetical protein